MSVVGCQEHLNLSKKCAEEGITLLKNEDLLPLENVKKIAVIGSVADIDITGDHGSSRVRPAYVVTILDGFKQYKDLEIIYDDGEDLKRARKVASEAEAVVLAVGYNPKDEGEYVTTKKSENYTGSDGGDRGDNLGLHDWDKKLIKEISDVNGNTVVVMIGGGMIMMTDWINEVKAAIMAYYPGQEGGNAIAEVILGDINPSGKLPYVIPVSVNDLPKVDWFADDQYYEYYHGYTRLEKLGIAPLYPYGYGLSYTTFAFSDILAKVEEKSLITSCKVKNTGDREGTEVVQLYIGCKNSKIDRPVKQLRNMRFIWATAVRIKI